jgi:single-strand DNA-binding protein
VSWASIIQTFATFELATKSSYKDKGGEWQSQTYWHHVVVFGKHADIAPQLTKGDYVELKGESRSSEFESVTDGVTTKHRRSEVRTTALRKLERPARLSGDAVPAEEVSEVAG